jgi:hypothetical protein
MRDKNEIERQHKIAMETDAYMRDMSTIQRIGEKPKDKNDTIRAPNSPKSTTLNQATSPEE